MPDHLIDSREHPAIQCRTCGSIVWTWQAARHLAEKHPELADATPTTDPTGADQ